MNRHEFLDLTTKALSLALVAPSCVAAQWDESSSAAQPIWKIQSLHGGKAFRLVSEGWPNGKVYVVRFSHPIHEDLIESGKVTLWDQYLDDDP